MSEKSTLIFDIEKFAVHDGPGIRTVVFMKGCPLHCVWCHNPESQMFAPEILFQSARCTGCGRCETLCPRGCHHVSETGHRFDRQSCRACGRCADGCLSGVLRLAGRRMTVDEVMHEVMKDLVFYQNSGGGLTLSGGEPMAHFDFTLALLQKARQQGLHTAVETSGFAPWEHFEALLDLVDLWLWDIKASPEKHEALTGVKFDLIYENLQKLSAAKAAIILRCPMVPGVNDEEPHLLQIARLANELPGIRGIDVEPCHPLGEGKNLQLGKEQFFHAPAVSAEDRSRWEAFIRSHTSVPLRIC